MCLLAGAIVLNVQIVIGFVPHSDHWPRAISPIIFLILFNMFYIWFEKFSFKQPVLKVFVPILLIGLCLLLVTKKIVNVYGFMSPSPEVLRDYVFPKRFAESWRWLDAHLAEPRVVSPSFLNSVYLTAFTSARPVLPVGVLTSISNFKVEELFLKVNNVFGVSGDILEKRLRDGRGLECLESCSRYYTISNTIDAPLSLYGSYFGGGDNVMFQRLPELKVQELRRRYQKLQIGWADLGAKYVYYGPWEKQFASIDLSRDQELQLIYKNDSVELYRIK
ncbi:MAG: hypothetical protein HYV54_02450 [Parcubacteria group bacterium]|nr:hypothetical protein [Parcubacteria group bacterium]